MIATNGGGTPPTVIPNPVTREEALKHVITEEAKARANSNPLPGPLGDAFDDRGFIVVETRSCGKLEVRPVVAYDFEIMRQHNMAMHQFILELAKLPNLREEIDWTAEERWVLCWMFTRPCAEVRKIYRKGKEAMQEAAFAEISDKLHPMEVEKIVEAVQLQFGKSIITAVEYGQNDGKTNEQFFQGAGDTPPMASAGGLAT
jgi:hypothetical protein